MPVLDRIQTGFEFGEITPDLLARVDLAMYSKATKVLENGYPFVHGGVTKRRGTLFIGEVQDSSKQVRLFPYNQEYTLVLNGTCIEVIKNTNPLYTITNELFRTGWETASNPDTTSWLGPAPTLEGWTLVTTPNTLAGGTSGFEVWHTGDSMENQAGNMIAVAAAPGNGSNWLELNDSSTGSQTLGIQRSVTTILDAEYTLSFDCAGRLGFGVEYVRIAVLVDDVELATFENTSSQTVLDWQSKTVTFTGTGGTQEVRFALAGTLQHAAGRGMMLDNIALTEVYYTYEAP